MGSEMTPDPAPQASDTPKSAGLLLATFAELYRHEVGAEEDVHRSLPFFGTALGIVVTALAYTAGRLPRWPDIATSEGRACFYLASGFLALTVLTALCVLILLAMATKRRDYERIGPEPALQSRFAELQALHNDSPLSGSERDQRIANDIRQVLLDSYTTATPLNRDLNRYRHRLRANASVLLVMSLNWVLAATIVTIVVDKLGYFPKVTP